MKRLFSLLMVISIVFGSLMPEANAFFGRKKKKEKVKKEVVEEPVTFKGKAVYLELEGDNVEFDQDENIYVTYGMSTAHIVDQQATLHADKIVFYGNEDYVEATGNVVIDRRGIITEGEKFTFDVTSEKYLLTEPKTVLTGAVIVSREVTNKDADNLEYTDGQLMLDDPIRIAQGFGAGRQHPRTYYSKKLAKAAGQKPTWDEVPKGRNYKFTARKIIYNNTRKRNNLTVIKPRLKFKRFTLPLGPSLTTTITDDPLVRSKPLLTPLIGTQGALGGFSIGPSINFNLTDYHLVSLIPFAQIGDGDEFGLGGGLAYQGPRTNLRFLYGSLKDRFVGRIAQKLSTNTELYASTNSYTNEGFLGSNLSKYDVGIYNLKSVKFPFTESGLRFWTSANWSQGDRNILPSRLRDLQDEAAGDDDDFDDEAFKFEEQVSLVTKPIINLGNEKINTVLRFRNRNAFRAYSTGELQGIFSGGPILDNTLGPLSFEIGYNQAFVEGDSPLFYDQYLEGMQSLSLDGDLRISEYLTLGGYGTYNLMSEEIIQRQFRAKVGPKDFKMLFNYDSLRQQTQFGVNFLFGRPIDFERFVIINSARRLQG